MRAPQLVLPLLLPLTACMEQGFEKTGGGSDGYGPDIEVTPTYLDFGTFDAEDDAVVRTFTIESVGSEDLHVESVLISSEDAGFTIVSDSTAFVLAPGESRDIDVAFTPAGAVAEANALVGSDDPEDPTVAVELVAAFEGPLLQIDPDPLEFPDTYVGCDRDDVVELISAGSSTLRITDIELSGEGFSLLTGASFPIELEPGESTYLEMNFTPVDDVEFEGTLSVSSNEPLGVRTATQLGLGKFGAEYTDEWVVPADPPTDIMFLLDQSCSMDDDTRAVANNIETFVSTLSGLSTDWQIIVASNDEGCNQGGILTPDTPGYEDTFKEAARECDSRYGCSSIVDVEALLLPAAAGVENSDGGECNDGFLREDALLHIIAVSDEPEQSACDDIWDVDCAESDWERLVDEIVTKKGSAALTKISAVAGPVPGGCSGGGNTADAGTGYAEAVEATGGLFLSLCSDWGASAEELAEASVQLDTFELSHTAWEPSIVVTVDGSPVQTGWSYDEDTNSVVFEGDEAPTEGQVVVISYGAPVSCD